MTEVLISDVNYEHLYQLLDMGFPFEQCREALLNTNSMEQATDYLLNNPPQARDQMMHAIAMSMNPSAESLYGNNGKANKKPKDDDCTPLTEKSIDEFIMDALPTCLRLLDILPDTVYRVCDLFVTITKRNGEAYRDNVLDVLLSEIKTCIDLLLAKCETKDSTQVFDFMLHSDPAAKMAVRMHLFSLLFEGPVFQEMRVPCAQAVQRSNIISSVIRLLVECEHYMKTGAQSTAQEANNNVTPKWLTPLILLLDLVEKVALCTFRKEQMHKVTKPVWLWYDISTSKWNAYTTANQKIINDAYWSGDTSVRVTCGRRRYTLTFNNMGQVNDESGNHRPISMTLIGTNQTKEQPPNQEQEKMEIGDGEQVANSEKPSDTSSTTTTTTTPSTVVTTAVPPPSPTTTSTITTTTTVTATPTTETTTVAKIEKRGIQVKGLSENSSTLIVRTCVNLMRLPIDRDTLQAVMRICLRLTRDFRCARIFAQEGGVKLLIEMTQASMFTGFVTIATLLIRHILEEPQALCLAIEKVIRGKALSTIPPSHKEILYLFRQVSSAVCRSPDAFFDVAKSILRIDISALHRRSSKYFILFNTLQSNL